jgi:hypothetical protein
VDREELGREGLNSMLQIPLAIGSARQVGAVRPTVHRLPGAVALDSQVAEEPPPIRNVRCSSMRERLGDQPSAHGEHE